MRLLAVALLLSATLVAQDTDAAAAKAAQHADPAAGKLAPDADPAAAGKAALDTAAQRQRGETPRGTPSSLHGHFHVTYHDDKGNLVQADVERWYVRQPERLLTRLTEQVTGLSTTEGWDGTTAWFQDTKKGLVVNYSADADAWEVDLAKSRDQLRLTRLLLDALVLDALRPRLADVRLVGRGSHTDLDDNPHEVRLVQASAPDEFAAAPTPLPAGSAAPPPARLQLVFGIDAADGTLWSLQVKAPGRPDYALRFDFHAATADGLRVPGNIRVYEAGSTEPQTKLAVQEDGEGRLQLELDTPVDAAMFALPAAKN